MKATGFAATKTIPAAPGLVLHGWAVAETGGVAGAKLVITAAGTEVNIPIHLAPNESTRDLLSEEGIRAAGGITVTVTGGAVAGSIFWDSLA